jgi:hypothetical protein
MIAHLEVWNPYERDRWGEIRWLRGYKRAVYWQASYYGGTTGLRGQPNAAAGSGWGAPVRVEWETGVRVREAGPNLGYWAIRIRLHPDSMTTARIGLHRAVRERNNWIDPYHRHPNHRQSGPDDRPWEAAA